MGTPVHRAAILRLLLDAVLESPLLQETAVEIDHLAGVLDRLRAHPDAGFLVATDAAGSVQGLLVLLLSDDLLAPTRLAAEVCWYVVPAARDGIGLQLLDAGEAWARQRGARRLQMLAPRLAFERVLQRRGYVPGSRVYERRL